MLSKEEKMKYGELLRQQIKERQDAKKAQRREHTPAQDPTILPPAQPQQRAIQMPHPQPEINLDRFKSDREAQKELLAKKMEEQAYNPFGKIGSGAPNKHINGVDPRQGRPNREQERAGMVDEQQQMQFIEEQARGMPMGGDPLRMNINEPPMQGQPFQGYRRIPTPQFLQGAYNNVPFVAQQYASPAPYGYVNVNQNDINYRGKIDITPRQMGGFEPKYEHLQLNYNQQQQQPFYPSDPYPPQPNPPKVEHRPQQNADQNRMEEIQKDVFRKGGRNLLKFENQIPQQIISKQNEKLRLQQQLKKQMEDAARRKKEEEQRLREEDERLQRKNKEFLEQEKKKYEEELNAKKGEAKNVDEANSNARKEPVNLKKEKFNKIREEVAKREEEERRQAQRMDKEKREKQMQKENANSRNQKAPHPHAHPKANEVDEAQSAISSETQMSRGFNTAISKQFFKREREKSSHKLKADRITSEMQKMRKEIAHQGHYYHKEIEKVQREAERARQEKEKADEEIHRLRQEIREKMDYNNKKFLEGIYEGKRHSKDPYYADEVTLKQPPNNILRPKKTQKLILQEYRPDHLKDYQPESHSEYEGQGVIRNDSEMMSLIGDSKKIPLEIEGNESLSISKLDNFAKDTEYFKKRSVPPLPRKYHPQESIQEEDERREESRQSTRQRRQGTGRQSREAPQEELDKLMESRKKSRGGWGELSSVNEEMVNEIENMLQDRQRPRSHLAKAGENSLQSYERSNPKNEMAKRKSSSVSQEGDSQGTINSLDRLIQKYM